MPARSILSIACLLFTSFVLAQSGAANKGKPVAAAPRAIYHADEDLWTLDPPFAADEPYVLQDRNGLVIGGATLRAGAAIDLSGLPPGIYVMRFSRRNVVVPIIRE